MKIDYGYDDQSKFVKFVDDGHIVDREGERITSGSCVVVFPSGYIGLCPKVDDTPAFDPLTGLEVFYPGWAEW